MSERHSEVNVLPADEAAQFYFEFARELERIETLLAA